MTGVAPGLAAALVVPCAELAPPAPPSDDGIKAAPRIEMSLAEVVWYGQRSSYADQERGCRLQVAEDLWVVESITLPAAEGRAVAAEVRADTLELRPTWGVVAGVGGAALLVGLVAGAIATR